MTDPQISGGPETVPGDVIYRQRLDGCIVGDVPLTVIRCNRVTFTVRDEYGDVFRVSRDPDGYPGARPRNPMWPPG